MLLFLLSGDDKQALKEVADEYNKNTAAGFEVVVNRLQVVVPFLAVLVVATVVVHVHEVEYKYNKMIVHASKDCNDEI